MLSYTVVSNWVENGSRKLQSILSMSDKGFVVWAYEKRGRMEYKEACLRMEKMSCSWTNMKTLGTICANEARQTVSWPSLFARASLTLSATAGYDK